MNQKPLVAGLLLAAGVLLWLALPGQGREEPAPPLGAVGASAPPGVPSVAAAAIEPPAAQRPASQSPSVPAGGVAGVWDLCGIGRVPVPPGPHASGALFERLPELPLNLGAQAQEQALERTVQALQRGNARQRAVAALWAGFEGTERLAAMAMETGDALALQVALQRCPERAPSGPCAQLMPDALARAEPDNLLGWLIWAYRRPQEHALWVPGILAARHHTTRWGQVPQVLLAALPPELPGYLGVGLAIDGMGVQAALPDVTLTTAGRLCRAPPSGAHGLCEHLAQVLVGHSDTYLAQGVGVRFAQVAGWPPERLAAARLAATETSFVLGRESAALTGRAQPLDCTGVQNWRAYVEAVGTHGEPRAAQALQRAASVPR